MTNQPNGDDLSIIQIPGRVRFAVRVQPRASRNQVMGLHANALRVRITAPPVDHAANDELVSFLADVFEVPRRAITIVGGETSRSKVIEIEGVSERAVRDIVAGVGTTS